MSYCIKCNRFVDANRCAYHGELPRPQPISPPMKNFYVEFPLDHMVINNCHTYDKYNNQTRLPKTYDELAIENSLLVIDNLTHRRNLKSSQETVEFLGREISRIKAEKTKLLDDANQTINALKADLKQDEEALSDWVVALDQAIKEKKALEDKLALSELLLKIAQEENTQSHILLGLQDQDSLETIQKLNKEIQELKNTVDLYHEEYRVCRRKVDAIRRAVNGHL